MNFNPHIAQDFPTGTIHLEGIGKRFRLQHRTNQKHRMLLNKLGLGPKHYKQSLADISFHINPGEAVGLIGANGAGKSTLLRILAQTTKPTTGQGWAVGRVASILEVGAGFHFDLTGEENVYLSGAALGMHRWEVKAKFKQIAEFSGIGDYLYETTRHYSSGMFVRLAFSVVAHLDGDILLVDEALAVGDAAFQAQCLARLKDMRKLGRTIILTSHDMQAITQSCARAILISQGRLAFDGPSQEAAAKYLGELLPEKKLT